jgi:ribosomal 50S subunit-recycling heat shock protein
MRIDLALKYLCLVKSRSIAKNLCAKDRILADGRPVQPASAVRAGERVTIRFPERAVTVRILAVPEKQLSKAAALAYYELVETPGDEMRAGGE